MLDPALKNTVKYYAAGLLLALPFGVLSAVLIVVGYNHPSDRFLIVAVIAAVPCAYAFFRAAIPFGRMVYYVRKVRESEALFLRQAGCSVFQGALGAGKSSLAGYILVLNARQLWAQLQADYLTMSVNVRGWRKQCDWDRYAAGKIGREEMQRRWLQLRRWDEVKQAYRYYARHRNRVPCLFSNISVTVDGKTASKLTVEHLLQRRRLPAYTAVFADELGYMIDKWLVTERNDDTDAIAILFRFFRQFFGNGTRFIGTEQDSSNVLKDLRRVMASNEYILGQDPVLRPRLLLWLLDRKERRLFRRAPDFADADAVAAFRRAVGKYRRFEALVKSIGFRRYRYVSLGNTEHDFGSGDTLTAYTPATLNFTYYDRTFERLYRRRYGKISAGTFDTDTVPPDTERLRAAPTAPLTPQAVPAESPRTLPPWIRPGHNAKRKPAPDRS